MNHRCTWRLHVDPGPEYPPFAASCTLDAGHSPSIAHETGVFLVRGNPCKARWHTSNHVVPTVPTAAEREAYLRGQLHGYEREAAAAARALSWRRDAAGYVAFWLLFAVSVLAGRRRI
jgi:hypothetical protein